MLTILYVFILFFIQGYFLLFTCQIQIQLKITKEYAQNHIYYDRRVTELRRIKRNLKLFGEWKEKLLKQWQFQIVGKLMNQSDRKILWIVDHVGNNGKTFLSMYLHVLYNFAYIDGVINTRDLPNLVPEEAAGVVIDVSRAALQRFDYSALESIKNGFFVSGKYRGEKRLGSPLKILVCSNGNPDRHMLSEDRWDVITFGDVDFIVAPNDIPRVSPRQTYPFIEPVPLPDFSEQFRPRPFLLGRLPPIENDQAHQPPPQVREPPPPPPPPEEMTPPEQERQNEGALLLPG